MDYFVSQPNSRRKNVDLISELPDSILLHILSFLSTKDAIKTSILAKRWKLLWTYLCDFDFEETTSTGDSLCNQVDGILEKVAYIKRFRIDTTDIPVDAERVKSWISALLKYKIEELYILLSVDYFSMLANNLSAPESLNVLHLSFLDGFVIPTFVQFSGLKTLSLSFATFPDETSAQQIFSACPVLENLDLCGCQWNMNSVNIKIPTLRTLSIEDDCVQADLLPICKVTIDAVNLVSLICLSYKTLEFVLINLISLAEAEIDVYKGVDAAYVIKLLSGICHAKSLKISNDALLVLSDAENLLARLPIFHNLTHIHVPQVMFDSAIESLMDIFEKSPNLEVLDVNVEFLSAERLRRGRVPHCFKYSLKSIRISEFDGSAAHMKLLRNLLRNAMFLERIEIVFTSGVSTNPKKQVQISNRLHQMRSGLAIRF